jgi:hypothetical protein
MFELRYTCHIRRDFWQNLVKTRFRQMSLADDRFFFYFSIFFHKVLKNAVK